MIPVVSSAVIHVGIGLAALWLAFYWTPPPMIVLPVELVDSEPAPQPPETPSPPAPRPKPVSVAKPIPPSPPLPRETPPHLEPEVARPAPPPEPPKVLDPPALAAEASTPSPVVMAPSPQVEPKPVEIRKEQAPATNGVESRVTAIGPAPVAAASSPAPSRPPSPEPSPVIAAAPARAPGAPGPVVAARPGEVSRAARPSGGYQVIPSYPAAARQQRIEGTTLLRVLVLADGRVGNIAVQKSAGHPDLDRAAADAVRQWHFDPARKGSETVAMWVLLPVEFHLKDR